MRHEAIDKSGNWEFFMSWLAIVIIGYTCSALVLILDKFILTKSVSDPAVYTFYSTIFLFGMLLAWPFGVKLLIGIDWFIALASGLSFGFGLWSMFVAVKRDEASRIYPLIGAVVTVVSFLLASLFLSESLSLMQQVGILVLVGASFLYVISQDKKKSASWWTAAFSWAFISGSLFAISHVTAKYLYNVYPFLTGFVWTRVFIGFVAFLTFLSPAVRASFCRRESTRSFGKRHALAIIVFDKVLGVVGVVLIQYAIAIGSVTLVNALVGLQYALMFMLIYFLTLFVPKIFSERLTRREFVLESIAVILVVLGAGLFVI